jgi:uncharacterized protein YlxW (UPF0749 family)
MTAPVGPEGQVVEPDAPDVLRRMLSFRLRRVDLLIAALLLALGFGAAVQVRSTRDDGLLASARQEDLVLILDDLSGRSERLRNEVTTLTAAKERLASDQGATAALEEARRRTQLLGVLAGTVPASGPGVALTVQDTDGSVRAEVLLDALEELRDAGAEAVQVEGAGGKVRVVASTAFLDAPSGRGVVVDGTTLRPPYRVLVVGQPSTLTSALGIPGGVLDKVRSVGGAPAVATLPVVRITALKALSTPRYARPAE